MEDTASAEDYETQIREYETQIKDTNMDQLASLRAQIREYETDIEENETEIRALQTKELDRISKGNPPGYYHVDIQALEGFICESKNDIMDTEVIITEGSNRIEKKV